jgi:hypothetical protein
MKLGAYYCENQNKFSINTKKKVKEKFECRIN